MPQGNCPAMMKQFSELKIAIKAKTQDAVDFCLGASQNRCRPNFLSRAFLQIKVDGWFDL